jgi:Zn-dependent peptidase ImmA (M78 family)
MDYHKESIPAEMLRRIKAESAYVTREYADCVSGPVRDGIFSILERAGTLILYPFNEKDLCGIYIFKDEQHFFILNTSIPLERQVFAAAHEFAHSLDIARVMFEVVTCEILTEYSDHAEAGKQIQEADEIANRFAAELLLEEESFNRAYERLPKEHSMEVKAVLLSDWFLVPYKAIIRRFAETGMLLESEQIERLLHIDTQELERISLRFECCTRNKEVSKDRRLGGYRNKALLLYEQELSTYEELKERLALLGETPQAYGVFDDSYDYYKGLKLLACNP